MLTPNVIFQTKTIRPLSEEQAEQYPETSEKPGEDGLIVARLAET